MDNKELLEEIKRLKRERDALILAHYYVPLEVQEKILRTVEYGTFERIGSSITRKADVRIIAATNADLPALAREGRFKEDLLDRLSFEVIFVPPLRCRGNDVILLANHFAARMATECDLPYVPYFSPEAEALIKAGTPFTNAAEKCGFSDYSCFYRCFHNKYKMSPQKYFEGYVQSASSANGKETAR